MAKLIIDAKNNLSDLMKKNDLPILLDFWAPWCNPCKELNPVIDELANRFKQKLQIIKINIDENQEARTSYSVKKIPTLIFLNKNREIVHTMYGYHSLDKLVETLAELPLWEK